MAIAYDATGVGTQSTTTAKTWTHTCSGSNRILFVSCMADTTDVVTGVTYNSVSMTLVGKKQMAATNNRWLYLFYLIAPATGANTVSVNASSSVSLQGTSTSYTGAAQGGQPDSSNTGTTNSSTSFSLSTTVVNSSCWLVMASADNQAGESAGSGTTLRNSTNGNAISDSNGTVSTGSQSLALTVGASGNWAGVIASFLPDTAILANYLVVAGGGGGGQNSAGGGGAGGMLTGSTAVSAGSYPVTVGAGGAGKTGVNGRGANGGDSVFNGITATGGGGGGGAVSPYTGQETPNNGGSGGGGETSSVSGVSGGTGTAGQGNNGGSSNTIGAGGSGGGGGGAGAVGSNASGSSGGAGGAGSSSSISGSSVTYAGGGGGEPGGAGGSGGGGAGGSGTAGSNGTANTGGGGGAGPTGGGNGGSGIVIISVATGTFSATTSGANSFTQSGGNDIWTFTASGTWTPTTPSGSVDALMFGHFA